LHLDQRNVRGRFNEPEQEGAMRIQLRAPWLALSACRSFPALPSPAHPTDGCCDPDPELNRRSSGWEARQRRVDHPVS
jgi:hypothetical protein